ncbi:MAG: NADH-quinone oxidoreductase subunit J [Microthrixaceae bacterium]
MKVEMFTFLVSAAICLGGALGVVLLRNTVHNALSLIATLFGVAVLFMSLGAYFLAAVQVIVYAGAIVVLFLFVIMLLGVDKLDRFQRDAIVGQRPAALVVGLAILGLSITALLSVGSQATGRSSTLAAPDAATPDINSLAKLLFTDYVFALEITSVLLTIAVVGAVVLARRGGEPIDLEEFPEGPAVVEPPLVDPADSAGAGDVVNREPEVEDSAAELSTEEASR